MLLIAAAAKTRSDTSVRLSLREGYSRIVAAFSYEHRLQQYSARKEDTCSVFIRVQAAAILSTQGGHLQRFHTSTGCSNTQHARRTLAAFSYEYRLQQHAARKEGTCSVFIRVQAAAIFSTQGGHLQRFHTSIG